MKRSTRSRWLFLLGTFLLFVAIYIPVYNLVGRWAIALSFLPIIGAGSQFGKTGGAIATLLSVPINIVMFLASGESDLSFWGRNYLLTHIVFLIVGLTTGYLGDLKMKLEHELSERKRLEEKIRAIERDRVLIETAGAASHEINQPLQGVLGYCELLLQNIDENSPYRQQIEKIQECGEKISTILKKMQTANQYATRTYVQEFKIVDFDAAQSHSKTQKK